MEAFLLIWIIMMAADTEWCGRHLAKIEVWKDYYLVEERQSLQRTIAKTRLKRIRKKYPNAFRSTK